MKFLKMYQLLLTFAMVFCVNGVASAEAVELGKLHANAGLNCSDCHGDVKKKQPAPMFACLQCHDTQELAATTKDVQPTNPHKNRHNDTETNCNSCHHQHKPSENACIGCHPRFEFKKLP
ncbi:cytochrome c3 family protein [Shewanella mesophila]|uniref:cytochrome c3 family protein n=1 Tax=Shewanella mesophila TaxID=2864208 RepID=UPI0021ABA470|nr:cytochrome c3 family protein [Shewanella mesophila]